MQHKSKSPLMQKEMAYCKPSPKKSLPQQKGVANRLLPPTISLPCCKGRWRGAAVSEGLYKHIAD